MSCDLFCWSEVNRMNFGMGYLVAVVAFLCLKFSWRLCLVLFYAFCALLLPSSVHVDMIVRHCSCFLLCFATFPFC